MGPQSESQSAVGRDAATLLASLHNAYKLVKSESPSKCHYTEVITVLCVLEYKRFRQVCLLFKYIVDYIDVWVVLAFRELYEVLLRSKILAQLYIFKKCLFARLIGFLVYFFQIIGWNKVQLDYFWTLVDFILPCNLLRVHFTVVHKLLSQHLYSFSLRLHLVRVVIDHEIVKQVRHLELALF